MGKEIEIVVDDKLRIRLDSLPKKFNVEICSQFVHSNPEYHKVTSLGYKGWSIPRFIKTWEHKKDKSGKWWLCLPRGGMERLKVTLDQYGLKWNAIDNRTEGEYLGTYNGDWVTGDIFLEHVVTLRNYQKRIVRAIKKYENCIVRAPTGSGKTTAVIGAISEIQLPTIVVVWSTSLLKQWVDRVAKELQVNRQDIGIIQGSKIKLRPITLAMQQTLNRYTDSQWDNIIDKFGMVVCDEVQRYAATTFIKSIHRFPCRYRIGISADERRKDKKEFLIYDMFGRIAEDIPKKELEAKKFIHEVEVYVVPTEFKADWYREQRIDDDQVPDYRRLIDEMISDEDRNELLRRTISMLAKKKYRTLVFSQRVDHCKRLDTLMTASGYKSGLLIGGHDYQEIFEETKQGLIDGSRVVGIGTLSGGASVGLDIPQVSHGVLATPIHNNKQFMNQVTGRLCRISDSKTRAQIYILWDRHIFGKQPLMNFKKWYNIVKVKHGRKWYPIDYYLKEYIDYAKTKRFEQEFGKDSPFTSAEDLRR